MKELITPESAQAVVDLANQLKKASIFISSTQKPFAIQSITLNLATAQLSTQPFRVGFPFKSVYVSAATDVLANVVLIPTTQDSYQSGVPLKLNDSWTIDEPTSEAYIYWTAQAGKTITLHFFVNSEFRTGSQISVTGGGVSIVEGSTLSTTRVALTAITATSVLAADSTRKTASIQNNTGADVWFGGPSVSNTGANLGYKVPAGGTFIFKNTGTLYAYSVAGGTGDNGLLVMTEI